MPFISLYSHAIERRGFFYENYKANVNLLIRAKIEAFMIIVSQVPKRYLSWTMGFSVGKEPIIEQARSCVCEKISPK